MIIHQTVGISDGDAESEMVSRLRCYLRSEGFVRLAPLNVHVGLETVLNGTFVWYGRRRKEDLQYGRRELHLSLRCSNGEVKVAINRTLFNSMLRSIRPARKSEMHIQLK